MEQIENKRLNDLRIALYNVDIKEIAGEIGKSETTTRNALKYGLGTEETWTGLEELVKRRRSEKNQKKVNV